jgi:enamine deaminase RidA (YjgF/YER057c/UK114 family)
VPAAQKKNKEEQTQVLQLPRDLPNSVTGPTRRLSFHVTPLSSKGLLSPQIREALKALAHETSGETVLKIRAFVAGSGDVRRVRDLVSEVFTDRKQPLPALSLVRAGALPLEGAQVVLEAVAAAKKEVNPYGLAFLSPVIATTDNPLDPVAPLAAKSLAGLDSAVRAAGSEPADVLRITCFLSSLQGLDPTRTDVAARYPRAAEDFIQTQRAPSRALAACEAVARLRRDPGGPLRLLDPEGLSREPGESHIAVVNSPDVVFTGTQVSFGYQEPDSRLAFDRLLKEMEQAHVTPAQVAFTHYYALAPVIAGQVRQIRSGLFDAARPPAGCLLLFEGLPSMDAGFAVEVVAAK